LTMSKFLLRRAELIGSRKLVCCGRKWLILWRWSRLLLIHSVHLLSCKDNIIFLSPPTAYWLERDLILEISCGLFFFSRFFATVTSLFSEESNGLLHLAVLEGVANPHDLRRACPSGFGK